MQNQMKLSGKRTLFSLTSGKFCDLSAVQRCAQVATTDGASAVTGANLSGSIQGRTLIWRAPLFFLPIQPSDWRISQSLKNLRRQL
jgi:hypothetical protein